MASEPNLVLTGMMGAGKTTVGRLLATQLDMDFVDLDEVIEDEAGISVQEIFSRHGEAHFRELESLALREALALPNRVIATGGGAILKESNRDMMAQHLVAWLAIDSETAAQRLNFDGTRPLLLQGNHGAGDESDAVAEPALAGTAGEGALELESGSENDAMVNWRKIEAERRWAYAECDLVVDGTLSPEAVARNIGNWRQKIADHEAQDEGMGQVRHLLVEAEGGTYPIHIGHGLLDNLGQRCRYETGLREALIVSNPTVFALHGERLKKSLADAGVSYETILIPDGEEFKYLATVERIYGAALDMGLDRSSGIVALGGGVVGDIAGFAAATYMRGVKFIQVPTTLLAQVDSSVGGKVGVNHPSGKNLIGAFYQPKIVVADLDTLEVLPRRQFLTGMAEVIKCAFIYDTDLLEDLEKHAHQKVSRSVLAQWVKRSCEIKAHVVALDTKEMGYREILNFGHTVGHGVEQVAGYGYYTHGEAVSMGMVTAAILSSRKGYLSQVECQRIVNLLKAWELPIALEELPLESIVGAAATDKKARQGQLRFVLLHGLGNAKEAETITLQELLEALKIQQEGLPCG